MWQVGPGRRRPPTLLTVAGGVGFLVGVDELSALTLGHVTLAVVPVDVVRRDTALMRTLIDSQTVGDLRRRDSAALSMAWEVYESRREGDENLDIPFDDLPDETDYDFVDWFGEDCLSYLPQVRLRTTEHTPASLLRDFGHDDAEIGIDYRQASWFDPEDREAIEDRLRAMGHTVVHDDVLLARYSWELPDEHRRPRA